MCSQLWQASIPATKSDITSRRALPHSSRTNILPLAAHRYTTRSVSLRFSLLLLLCVTSSFCLVSSHALILFVDGQSFMLAHKTAAFGPAPHTYAASGMLNISRSVDSCSTGNTVLGNGGADSIIVMTDASDACSGWSQAHYAMRVGASALVIGAQDDRLFRLEQDRSAADQGQVTIPTVVISRASFTFAADILATHQQVQAMLNDTGEVAEVVLCGNGVLDPGEECELGYKQCSPRCQCERGYQSSTRTMGCVLVGFPKLAAYIFFAGVASVILVFLGTLPISRRQIAQQIEEELMFEERNTQDMWVGVPSRLRQKISTLLEPQEAVLWGEKTRRRFIELYGVCLTEWSFFLVLVTFYIFLFAASCVLLYVLPLISLSILVALLVFVSMSLCIYYMSELVRACARLSSSNEQGKMACFVLTNQRFILIAEAEVPPRSGAIAPSAECQYEYESHKYLPEYKAVIASNPDGSGAFSIIGDRFVSSEVPCDCCRKQREVLLHAFVRTLAPVAAILNSKLKSEQHSEQSAPDNTIYSPSLRPTLKQTIASVIGGGRKLDAI